MALLSKSESKEIEKIRVELDSAVLAEIKSYCDFAGISCGDSKNDIGEFAAKSMDLLNQKDNDWKKYRKNPGTVSN